MNVRRTIRRLSDGGMKAQRVCWILKRMMRLTTGVASNARRRETPCCHDALGTNRQALVSGFVMFERVILCTDVHPWSD
jgi:hypothetical protein